MDLIVQLMMGVSLAACAGLRAWLPVLCLGLLARSGYVELSPAFAFLERLDLLIVCGIATALELLGDKIVAVDNVLDAIGTGVRPLAGTLLAASVVTHVDPVLGLVIGLILGGGTAFTIHAGKAVLRGKTTALAPVHAGTGNVALSLGEDFLSAGGIGLAVWLPALAFLLVLSLLFACARLIRATLRHGKRLFDALGRPRTSRTEAGAVE